MDILFRKVVFYHEKEKTTVTKEIRKQLSTHAQRQLSMQEVYALISEYSKLTIQQVCEEYCRAECWENWEAHYFLNKINGLPGVDINSLKIVLKSYYVGPMKETSKLRNIDDQCRKLDDLFSKALPHYSWLDVAIRLKKYGVSIYLLGTMIRKRVKIPRSVTFQIAKAIGEPQSTVRAAIFL